MALLTTRRVRGAVDRVLWGTLLGVGALGLPLGLGRVEPAPLVAAAVTLRPDGAHAPLGILAAHLLGWLPFGDLALRANVAALLLAGLGAVAFGRAVLETLCEIRAAPTGRPATPAARATAGRTTAGRRTTAESTTARRTTARRASTGPTTARRLSAARTTADRLPATPPSTARPLPDKIGLDDTVAAVAGAVLPFACFGGFVALTSDPGASATFWVVASVWLHGQRLLRAPGATREGLWLFFLAGLSLGAEPVAALVAIPVALKLGWAGLRGGERWPLLAPLLAVAGAALAVGATVGSSSPGRGFLGALSAGVAALGAEGTWSWAARGSWTVAGAEALAQVGVLAALLAAFGFLRVASRVPWVAAGIVVSSALALFLTPAGAGRFGSGAWVVVLAGWSLPMAAGIAHVAASLGPGRAAGALVVAVVALVGPVLDGGSRRWPVGPLMPERLLVEAHTGLPPGVAVDPGSRPMQELLDLGAALGLRPDLDVRDRE